MVFIAWSSFTLFPLHLLLAISVLKVKPHTNANLVFALMNLVLGVWAFSHGSYVLAPDKATAWVYHRIATVSWLIVPSIIFHFLSELTAAGPLTRRRLGFLVVAYAPLPLWIGRLFATGRLLDHDLAHGAFGWYEKSTLSDPWAIAVWIVTTSTVLAGLSIVWRWRRHASRPLEKRHGQIILVSGASSLATAMLYAGLLPAALPSCQFSTLSPLTTAIWIFGIWFAITRYGLLHISPAIAAENILQMMAEPLIITDEAQRIVRVNAAFEEFFRAPAAKFLTRSIGEVFGETSIAPAEWKSRLDQDSLQECEAQLRDPDGRERAVVFSGTRVQDPLRTSSGFVVMMRDVTALKQAEERLRHLATHDPLTKLPNRVLFKDRVEQALARAHRNKTLGAVLMLDLNGFKQINDTYGHEAGDEILRQVAGRCRQTLRATDTAARLGGDEFVALLTDLKHCDDAKIATRRLEAALTQPMQVGRHTLSIGVSIGMSVFPDEGTDLDGLMKIADSAMYVAKEGSKIVESTTMRQTPPLALGARDIASALPLALENNEFELWFQTLHDAKDGNIVACEALLRWKHPIYGAIGPLHFVPIAERSGLIVPIGTWVLRMACIQTKAWQSTGTLQVPVAVNVSVKQLIRADFVETVSNVLQECDLDADRLHIEISEAAALHDHAAIKNNLVALHDLGVRLVIDDFGSGYTALGHLSALSVHAIKISQFLIQNMAHDRRDATIVRAIVAMANAFGIHAIAKGVETHAQLEYLRGMHWDAAAPPACDVIQGFVYSRPVPARELEPHLAALKRQPDEVASCGRLERAVERAAP